MSDVSAFVEQRAIAMRVADDLLSLINARFLNSESLAKLFPNMEDVPTQVVNLQVPDDNGALALWQYWRVVTVGEGCRSQHHCLDIFFPAAFLYGYFREQFTKANLPILRPGLSLYHDCTIVKVIDSNHSYVAHKVNGFEWAGAPIDLHLPSYIAHHNFSSPVLLQNMQLQSENEPALWQQIEFTLERLAPNSYQLVCRMEPSRPTSGQAPDTWLFPLNTISPYQGATLVVPINTSGSIALHPILRIVEVNPPDFSGIGPGDGFIRLKLHKNVSYIPRECQN